MTSAILILLLAIYAYLCSRTVRKGLLVFVACLPLYLIKLDIGPLPTNLLELLFVVLTTVWILGFVSERRRDSVRQLVTNNRYLFVGITCVLLGAIVGLTQTADVAGGLNIIKSYLVEPIILGFIIWNVSRSSEHFRVLEFFVALAVPVIVLGVVAVFQALTGYTIPSTWVTEGRVTSLYPYPNALSHFIAPIFTVIAVFLTDGKSRMSRLQRHLLVSALVLGALAVILAQTEAAILAIFGSLFLASFLYARGPRFTIPLAGFALLLVLVMPPIRTVVLQKVTLQDWSGQTRIAQWQETTAWLASDPRHLLLGAGPNNYPIAIQPFHTHTHLEIFQYPHNILLNTLVEFGLLGVIGFLLILCCIAHITKHASHRYYVVALAAGLMEMVIHGLVDVPFLKNDLAMLTSVLLTLLLISADKARAFRSKQLLA